MTELELSPNELLELDKLAIESRMFFLEVNSFRLGRIAIRRKYGWDAYEDE